MLLLLLVLAKWRELPLLPLKRFMTAEGEGEAAGEEKWEECGDSGVPGGEKVREDRGEAALGEARWGELYCCVICASTFSTLSFTAPSVRLSCACKCSVAERKRAKERRKRRQRRVVISNWDERGVEVSGLTSFDFGVESLQPLRLALIARSK